MKHDYDDLLDDSVLFPLECNTGYDIIEETAIKREAESDATINMLRSEVNQKDIKIKTLEDELSWAEDSIITLLAELTEAKRRR
jgi:hypothetical protein